jgi:hypothetical protein
VIYYVGAVCLLIGYIVAWAQHGIPASIKRRIALEDGHAEDTDEGEDED